MKGGFEEDAILQWGSQKEASATSATSARIYKASWTGDVWASNISRVLKGDRPSMEKHDCPVVKKEGVQTIELTILEDEDDYKPIYIRKDRGWTD